MAAQITRFILILNFQIILTAAYEMNQPMNTLTKIESLRAQPARAVEEVPQMINNFASSCQLDVFPNPFPTFSNMNYKFDNCFKIVLSYCEECALKYSQYNKIQPFKAYESALNTPMPFMNPVLFDTNLPIKDSTAFFTSSSELNLPLSSSLTPECHSMHKSLEINNFDSSLPPFTFVSYPSFDLSNSLTENYSNSMLLPLSLSSTVMSSEPSNSAKSFALAESSFIPSRTGISSSNSLPTTEILTVNDIFGSDIQNFGPLLPTQSSTFTLPLSVTSTTTSVKPSQLGQSSLLSVDDFINTPSSLNSFSSSQIPSHCSLDELFVPSPNILPCPLISSSVLNCQGSLSPPSIYTAQPLVSPSPIIAASDQNHCLCPSLINADSSISLPYICPTVLKPIHSLPLISYQEFYTGPSNIAPKLDVNLAPSLYRNCNTLRPILAFYPNTFNSISTMQSQIEASYLSDSSYLMNEYNSFYNLPYLLDIIAEPQIHHISTEVPDSTYASTVSLTNGLLSTPSSSIASCCLPLTPFPAITSSLPLSNDVLYSSSFEPDFKSYKRSPNSDEILPESNSDPTMYVISDLSTSESTTEDSLKHNIDCFVQDPLD